MDWMSVLGATPVAAEGLFFRASTECGGGVLFELLSAATASSGWEFDGAAQPDKPANAPVNRAAEKMD